MGAGPAVGDGHVIVCGLGRFGLKIVELFHQKDVPTVVVTDAQTRADRIKRARELGAEIVVGDFRFAENLEAAGVHHARALLLVAAGETANLETALDVRRIAPQVRIIMRLASDKLSDRLCRDFAIEAVLSPPVLAAREFARAALDTPPPARPAPKFAAHLPRRLSVDGSEAPRDLRSEPRLLAAGLMVMFLAAVAVFQRSLHLSLVDAVYFTSTIITTVGFGDFNLRSAPPLVKLFGSLLMFSGVILIAILTSLLTNFLVSGASAQRRAERTARRYRGHIILCGLGSVGFEVAEHLLEQGARVVVVDETPGDVHWMNLSARVPLLVGDARHPDILVRAGIGRARALIAAASDDAVNLEIGLVAQSIAEECRPDRPLRLVLRCFDPDLKQRIHAVSDVYTLLSSAEISAPIFVARALATGE